MITTLDGRIILRRADYIWRNGEPSDQGAFGGLDGDIVLPDFGSDGWKDKSDSLIIAAEIERRLAETDALRAALERLAGSWEREAVGAKSCGQRNIYLEDCADALRKALAGATPAAEDRYAAGQADAQEREVLER